MVHEIYFIVDVHTDASSPVMSSLQHEAKKELTATNQDQVLQLNNHTYIKQRNISGTRIVL